MKSLKRSSLIIRVAALLLLISLSGISLFGCSQGDKQADAEITVYGSPSCSLCNALKADLEGRNIAYTFVDISSDRDALVELSRSIAEESWYDGTIAMPIVSVGETFLRRPTLDEIRAVQSQ